MYKINPTENRITPLEAHSFTELGYKERQHLQEWLVHQPDALGEELLIIQKEFDGFDETSERLDLLALDKNGQLVLIENKLDDSGRNVVWQALKYAAYCSTLSTDQIVKIYEQYLNRHVPNYEGNARAQIIEFLGIEDEDELSLNPGSSQRVFLVAGEFRREVTATALWLMSYGLDVRCIRAKAFSLGNETILDIQQVIPTPEAQDYMIGLAEKEKEHRGSNAVTQTAIHSLRKKFWSRTIEALVDAGLDTYEDREAPRDSWFGVNAQIPGVRFYLVFVKNGIRVLLRLCLPEASSNTAIFDKLYANKGELEDSFGEELDWRRMDDFLECQIRSTKVFDTRNEDNWPEMINWIVDHRKRLEITFSAPLEEAYKAVIAEGL